MSAVVLFQTPEQKYAKYKGLRSMQVKKVSLTSLSLKIVLRVILVSNSNSKICQSGLFQVPRLQSMFAGNTIQA